MVRPRPLESEDGAELLEAHSAGDTASKPLACPSHIRQLNPRPTGLIVSDPDRIRSILVMLSASHAMGVIRIAGGEDGDTHRSPSSQNVELVSGPRLFLPAEVRDSAWLGPWTVELQGLHSLIRFKLEPAARLEGGRFLLPTELECIYRRSERRVSAPPAALIRISRAGISETWLERPIRDIGYRGLQFVASPEDEFRPGERWSAAEVTWKHGPRIAVDVEVRHVSWNALTNELLCGAAVDASAPEVADQWCQEISSLLNPDTTLATTGCADKLWDLYDESGYFGLGGGRSEEFEHLKPMFSDAFDKLARAPSLGCCVVREYRGRIEATIALLQCWSGAWLAYQGARRQDNGHLALSGNSTLREMFMHAYEIAQQDVNLRWHVTFIRNDARFTRLSNFDFAESHNDGENAAIVPFRALELSCSRSASLGTRQDVDISAARDHEILAVCAALAKRFPYAYLDAYDLVAERCSLVATKGRWAKAGLARDRAILVARRQDIPFAAAIMDFAEQGVHLVGLLDSVHLVLLHPEGTECFPDLLRVAQQYYAVHGCRKFVLFEETGVPDYLEQFDVRDMGEANQVFFAASLTSEFLDYVSLITAPRVSGGSK
jgi:hypothetical protein